MSFVGETEYYLARNKFLNSSSPKPEPPKFDYRLLLKKFDTAEIAKSPIKYFDAVLNVTDELIKILSEYESARKDSISESVKISLKLNVKYIENPNLTPEENSLLAERQKFLAKRLELGTDTPKKKILYVKAQAEKFFERPDKINDGDNSIRQLAELQAESRADFELPVENLARIITDAQRKVDFFEDNKTFVASVVDFQAEWSDSYKAFKTSLRKELSAACREDAVDEEIFAAWYDDWQKKRFAIEQRFLPLVEFGLKGHLSNQSGKCLKLCRNIAWQSTNFFCTSGKTFIKSSRFKLAESCRK